MTLPVYWGAVAAALMARGRWAQRRRAVLESGIQVSDGVDGGAGRPDVEELVDAVPAARGVSGRYRSPKMTVLNRERDQATRAAGDVPGQAPAESFGTDPPVRIRRDDLTGQAARGCLVVGPGDEVLHPFAQGVHGEGAGTAQVVGVVIEQQLPWGNDAFQNTDGVHDRGDGHPGSIADSALGTMVGLVQDARGQVPSCAPGAARFRVGAAAAA
ncbi:hypothetical protein ABZ281_21055 [Streptomyces sp. NPDC006265]|uniref:hypothetical protein n=1 Tax=Streptomyces sp. NPDC006265 TaxID=3156740 RepID=UPI0033B398BC